jgi:hypothetical protein
MRHAAPSPTRSETERYKTAQSASRLLRLSRDTRREPWGPVDRLPVGHSAFARLLPGREVRKSKREVTFAQRALAFDEALQLFASRRMS